MGVLQLHLWKGLSSSLILSEGQDKTLGKKKKENHHCILENAMGERLPLTFLLQKGEAKKGNCGSVMEIYRLTVRLHPSFPISFFRDRKDVLRKCCKIHVPENPKMC